MYKQYTNDNIVLGRKSFKWLDVLLAILIFSHFLGGVLIGNISGYQRNFNHIRINARNLDSMPADKRTNKSLLTYFFKKYQKNTFLVITFFLFKIDKTFLLEQI